MALAASLEVGTPGSAMMISFASGELIHQFSRATAWSMLPPWLGMHQLMASRR